MKTYKMRPGIVRTKICGTFLLIPTREASQYAGVMKLNMYTATVWETLEKGKSLDFAFEVFKILTRKSDQEVQEKLDSVLKLLCDRGFLIEEEDT